MFHVYKLTREDGMEYIGITKNLKKRIGEHERSGRFDEFKITKSMILFSTENLQECEEAEEKFITEFDTYKNGLNLTANGSGKLNNVRAGAKFNTTGYKFSGFSKTLMSEAKQGVFDGENNPMFGKNHSDEAKRNMSEKKKGKTWITDGITSKAWKKDDPIPEGWTLGKTQDTDVDRIKKQRAGTIFITNGKECFSIKKEKFPEWQAKGYERGMITRNIKIMRESEIKKVSIFELQSHLDDGWIRNPTRDRSSENAKRRERSNPLNT